MDDTMDSTQHVGFQLIARSMKWDVLPQALEWEREAEDMFQKTKMEGGVPQRNVKLRKRRVDTRLRITHLW